MKKNNVESHDHLCEQYFYQTNSDLLKNNSFLIAYSGGVDSHVLLHLFFQLRQQYPELTLRSTYVDHGLQEQSKHWADHCTKITQSLAIPHQTLTLSLNTDTGESIEALARKARYAAIQEHLLPDEILITAQHQDDQAETLLLQLFRGAGTDGLASMPILGCSMGFHHWRPLLTYSQQSILDYAKKHQLNIIEDPSNKNLRFDRNFIRHELIPSLRARWPSITKTLTRAATLQGEASQLINQCMEKQLKALTNITEGTLSIQRLVERNTLEQKSLLRIWIKQAGFLAPSAKKLQHIIDNVIYSKQDACPSIEWGKANVRRYRDELHIMPKLVNIPKNYSIKWDLTSDIKLDYNLPTIKVEEISTLKKILHNSKLSITIRLRQGGEYIHVSGKNKSLKKLLQESSIPPWKRGRLPLIYANEILIYVYKIAVIDTEYLLENINNHDEKNF